jgi:peptide-methionine (R)-S-oxide reductase
MPAPANGMILQVLYIEVVPLTNTWIISLKGFNMKAILILLCILITGSGCFGQHQNQHNMDKKSSQNPYYSRTDTAKLHVSNAEWKKILSPDLYAVAREQATERPFTGKYWDSETKGTYYCAVCGNALFRSDAKFASTCGWPSFFESIRATSVIYKEDNSIGMQRIEVICGRCDSHLGHIFDDGPPPTHKRFCMNSISLDFEPL